MRLTWVNSINDAQRALLTSMDWYRDGKAIYRGLDTVARDDGVRPNSGPYRYKLCIKNAVDEQCSDEVSASPTPAPPSVPLDVKATRWPGMKGLMLDWFINDVPGAFFTAERQNANQKHWTELQR